MSANALAAVRQLLAGDGDAPAGPEEVLDALWLAASGVTGVADGRGGPRPSPAVTVDRPVVVPFQDPQPSPVARPATGNGPSRWLPVADAGPGPRVWDTVEDQLGLGRLLRPLRIRRPEPDRTEFDEEATVERSVGGQWEPVLRAATLRWPDLALVAEGPTAEHIWGPVVDSFGLVLERLGAFREVRRWHLHPPTGDGDAAVLTPWSSRTTARAIPADRLRDPTGRRLVVVLTDGSHGCWGDGTYPSILRRWASGSPVVVVSTVPARWWPAGGLAATAARVRSESPLLPNSRWRAVPVRRGGTEGEPTNGTPVPVVELDPRGLGPVAAVIAGEPRWVRTRVLSMRPRPLRAPVERPPAEAVGRFRSSVEARVYDLLLFLAGMPLDMRFIERVSNSLGPGSRRTLPRYC